ncbi:hypothetical protein [Enteractinococcus coprophilus]|uniref:DUF998 domain-containing protein n=1 Tax=Enteractinococcus coprophilus TaxID=1027633 RepID=A0A543AF40_9MICC|nr:hypothetical protein [Enteractinococcus coprophilus]TQL71191.1 hypothetical protein FB556_1660 [Enteractinococcus coprophilus]
MNIPTPSSVDDSEFIPAGSPLIWLDGIMETVERALAQQTLALWATLGSFVAGFLVASFVFWNQVRPVAGEGSIIFPMALIASLVAAAAFILSSYLHRAGETRFMPLWQTLISHCSFVAVTIAFGGVTGLSVLLVGHLLGSGLPGLELGGLGGGILTGVAAALAGRLSFQAGIDLSLRNLAALLFTFLIVGTVFAMLTEADPTWWQRNFSQLGIGASALAFNGTVIGAGLLVATIGSYIGRDLHRLLDDEAVPRITVVVSIWVLAGLALAGVGWFPLNQQPGAHAVAAFAALGLLVLAAGYTQYVLPGRPFVLRFVTGLLVVLIAGCFMLTFIIPVLTVTALESIVVGLSLLWMTTFVRVLSILTPNRSVASQRRHLLTAA